MNVKIIEYVVQVFKNIASTCNKIVDATDAEKYSNSIERLNQSVDETYAKMREIISEDDTLSSSEKVAKLDEIAKSQLSARKTCEEAINGNRENISKVVSELLFAFATCGISHLPKVISKAKKFKLGKEELDSVEFVVLEDDDQTNYIE